MSFASKNRKAPLLKRGFTKLAESEGFARRSRSVAQRRTPPVSLATSTTKPRYLNEASRNWRRVRDSQGEAVPQRSGGHPR